MLGRIGFMGFFGLICLIVGAGMGATQERKDRDLYYEQFRQQQDVEADYL